MVSTPLDIMLSAKGATIDVTTIEPKGGRTDTYRKKNVNSKCLHGDGVKARHQCKTKADRDQLLWLDWGFQ